MIPAEAPDYGPVKYATREAWLRAAVDAFRPWIYGTIDA